MSQLICSFRCDGVPIPQGSKSLKRTKRGRTTMVESSNLRTKTKPGGRLERWRAAVGWAARATYRGEVVKGAVMLSARFYVPRPKSVTRPFPTTKPDFGKLVRAVEDSLTSIVWRDDAQVIGYTNSGKCYADGRLPGVEVAVYLLEEE